MCCMRPPLMGVRWGACMYSEEGGGYVGKENERGWGKMIGPGSVIGWFGLGWVGMSCVTLRAPQRRERTVSFIARVRRHVRKALIMTSLV